MRTIMALALLANLLIAAWANTVFVANAGQRAAVSVNPVSTTASKASQEYPGF